MTEERREVSVATERDIMRARGLAREAAVRLGFGLTDVTRVVTATSELARNVFVHGKGGIVRCRRVEAVGRVGVELVFIDQGPGIEDLDTALTPGFSTSGGLGRGLSGSRRLMDEMTVDTSPGSGTTVTVRKWTNG